MTHLSEARAEVRAPLPVPSGETVRDLFERRAGLAPEAVALVFEGRELTYRELDRRANRLANALVRLGVGPEVPVALHLGRGPDMVVAMLGVHKAGGAYVPLDPGFPTERLEYMVRDSGVRVVLTDQPAERRLPVDAAMLPVADALAAASESSPEVRALPENLAYIIYTSGSTGRPKGVEILHGALASFLLSMQDRPGFSAADVLVAVTTLSFDIAGLEIFLPLVSGGRLVVAPRDVAMDGARLAGLLDAAGATVLQATPVTWKLLLQSGWRGSDRMRMFCGGEALTRELARSLFARGAELWNLYGPTETTIWSAVARIEPGDGPVPVGGAIAATDLAILDGALEPVPAGAEGELLIGGAGLARGYRGQPALTAERFVPHPSPVQPGARLYRTGDLARFAGDGQVEVLGRADHQVKVRGFRIELGEIESVLLEHPDVQDAVVVAADSKSGEKRLVAYVVPRSPAPEARELQDLAASRLPDYMRPAAFAFLKALPLTPNNKVDRRALPEIRMPDGVGQVVARTPTEEIVLGIWEDVLETGPIGLDDDFFGLGGHSLLSGQVIARLRDVLGIELPPGVLFEQPTPSRFAAEIERRRSAGSRELPPLEPVPREGALPASYAQERLWVQDRMEPGGNEFNLGYSFRLHGRPRVAALDRALAEIFRRHEILRTRILADSRPFQVVDLPPPRPLAGIDLSALGEADRERAAQDAVYTLQAAPFDLARGLRPRAALLRLGQDDHVFSLTLHHILCDGWSLGVIIREVTDLYGAFSSARPSPLPELPVQYADFAVWQRRWLQGELLEEQLAAWQGRLDGEHPPALLPTDRPASRAGGTLEVIGGEVSPDLLGPLLRLGREEGATLFMTLLSALKLLLHRYTGGERIAVATMHANRTHSALEDLIGFFVNVLPLQTLLSPELGFRELLRRVRRTALEAYADQDAPYEKIVERVRPDRAAGRNSLFQVLVVFQNLAIPPLRLPGLEVVPFALDRSFKRAAFDLTMTFVPDAGRLLVWAEYDAGLYERATIERLLGHFDLVLREITADPSRRIADVLREAGAARGAGGGTLWLTDPAPKEERLDGEARSEGLEHAREKAAAVQDQVAARRAKLSDKQLALLRQRLKK